MPDIGAGARAMAWLNANAAAVQALSSLAQAAGVLSVAWAIFRMGRRSEHREAIEARRRESLERRQQREAAERAALHQKQLLLSALVPARRYLANMNDSIERHAALAENWDALRSRFWYPDPLSQQARDMIERVVGRVRDPAAVTALHRLSVALERVDLNGANDLPAVIDRFTAAADQVQHAIRCVETMVQPAAVRADVEPELQGS